MIDYGAKGCRCFRDEVDVSRDGRVERIPGRWLPNAACPHHGLLADFTERMETGQYTVITKPVTIEPRQDITAPTGCRCSVNDPHPCAYCWKVQAELDMQRIAASGEDLSEEPDAWTPGDAPLSPGSVTCSRCGWTHVGTSEKQMYGLLSLHLTAEHSTTEEERRGVAVRAAAAVRRAWSRLTGRD